MSIDRLIIEKATITAGDGATKFDISAAITDVVIYEHIDKPYLTGSVSFLDTIGVLDQVKFKGLEQFIFAAKYPEDVSPTINRKFIIDAVVDTSKNNDNSELVTLHFIEEIGFVSSFLNVNRAYSGSSREIIQKIIMENFSGITLSKADEDEAKYDMQIVVPNMTPLEAANWIKDRTTSTSGTPYYLFSVLTQPNILHFLPLSTMISAPPVSKREYRYSQSSTQESTTSKDGEAQYYDIKNYNQVPLEISDLIDQGLISSVQGYWDTSTSFDTSTQFEIENVLGLVQGFNRDNFKFKNSYQHLGKSLNTIKSRKQYAIHSSYSYPDKVSFRELENLNRSLTAKALRNILVTGALDIAVSGRTFAIEKKNRTLGNTIKLRFLNNVTPTPSASIDDITDKVKSGKHMIYAVRHNIRIERYDVTLTCVKLENLE
jgi:hypothetical protein